MLRAASASGVLPACIFVMRRTRTPCRQARIALDGGADVVLRLCVVFARVAAPQPGGHAQDSGGILVGEGGWAARASMIEAPMSNCLGHRGLGGLVGIGGAERSRAWSLEGAPLSVGKLLRASRGSWLRRTPGPPAKRKGVNELPTLCHPSDRTPWRYGDGLRGWRVSLLACVSLFGSTVWYTRQRPPLCGAGVSPCRRRASSR